MATVTVLSDFGAQENKVSSLFAFFSPSTYCEVMGLDAMIFVFSMLSFTFYINLFILIGG